jgi:hypothetical protein
LQVLGNKGLQGGNLPLPQIGKVAMAGCQKRFGAYGARVWGDCQAVADGVATGKLLEFQTGNPESVIGAGWFLCLKWWQLPLSGKKGWQWLLSFGRKSLVFMQL